MAEAQEFAPDLEEIARLVAGKQATPLPVRFYTEAIENPRKSAEAGRPVFDDVEMVEIQIDRNDVRQRPVTREDIERYPAIYLAFKQGQSQESAEGTPLREWPVIKRSQAESLSHAGIRTVEQLAAASDAKLQQIGPLMALREKARNWLEEAKAGAGLTKLRAENEDLKSRVAALEKMLATQSTEIEAARNNGGSLPAAPDPKVAELERKMSALMDALASRPVADQAEPPKKRRGRPPKAKPDEAN